MHLVDFPQRGDVVVSATTYSQGILWPRVDISVILVKLKVRGLKAEVLEVTLCDCATWSNKKDDDKL